MDLSGLTQSARAEQDEQRVYTAQVVRADASGLWVVPLGEDPSSPVGPCKGGYTANGTRVPPGALVALVLTDDGPWAIGVDNPALAINDSTAAPFVNASFETPHATRSDFAASWSDFWSVARLVPTGPPPAGKYTMALESGSAAHGMRALRIDANGTYALISPTQSWGVPPGSSLEVSFDAKATGPDAELVVDLYHHSAGTNPGPFVSGATSAEVAPTADWLRHRVTITIPPTDTRVLPYFHLGAGAGTQATVWIDNVDVDIVEINPTVAHQDFMRRAALTMAGGGARLVTAGGNVAWSQPLTISGVGRKSDEATAGRFEISMPTNGTVIPVHSSGARTSHTVAGGVVALDADEALWYELPLGAAAASQPARFHIVGTTSADGYVIPPHWILVVRRTAWSATQHAPEYRWGDGQAQDPWRTPTLNAGWIDGTTAGRYTKTGTGLVVMRGRVRNGAGSAFTLPPGYRPAVQHEDYVRDGAGAAALITVTTAGVVTTAGNNTDHSIATTFPVAEQ